MANDDGLMLHEKKKRFSTGSRTGSKPISSRARRTGNHSADSHGLGPRTSHGSCDVYMQECISKVWRVIQ